MDLINNFENLPREIYNIILSYLPIRDIYYTHCIDQIKNIDKCLKEYKYCTCADTRRKYKEWDYMRFALHKNKEKILLNRGL